jgi:hypothetical protein
MNSTTQLLIASCDVCGRVTRDLKTWDRSACGFMPAPGVACAGRMFFIRGPGPEFTLTSVRELSENATLRPASKRLLLAATAPPLVTRTAIISFEELHPPVIAGSGTAHGRRPDSRKPRQEESPAIN